MKKNARGGIVFAVATLAITCVGAASADPPSPWAGQDINITKPAAKGSVDVDANGVWTIRGAGQDIFWQADQCYYVYQPMAGDASLTARFLSFGGGDAFRKAGLMVRQNLTPGSPNLNYHGRGTTGLNATVRFRQGGDSAGLWRIGPASWPRQNVSLRLQRMGQQITGFYSLDGVLWSPDFDPQSLPTLPEQALFGLAICSISDTSRTNARFDQIKLEPGAVLVPGLRSFTSDRRVMLEWQPVSNAVGYQIYRGPGGATPDRLVRLTSDRVVGTSFIDTDAGLANGVAQTYAVVPVFQQGSDQFVEGPAVVVETMPIEVPAGWVGCSMNEGPNPGSAALDAATGELAVRGAGGDDSPDGAFENADQGYFLGQPVDGDFQITVKALTKPEWTHGYARAALMIRDSLESSSRYVAIALTATKGLWAQRRMFSYRDTAWTRGLANGALSLPVTLRLTRKGNTVTPEYSTDDGKSFQSLGSPVTFAAPLGASVQVGLMVSSNYHGRLTEARFGVPQIEKL